MTRPTDMPLKSRLARALAIRLLGAVALTAAAMALFMAWNLRQGFSTYLQTRDLERIDALAAMLESELARNPTAPEERNDTSNLWPRLLRRLAATEGAATEGVQLPPHQAGPDGPDRGPLTHPSFAGPGPSEGQRGSLQDMPPPPPESFGARVLLLHPDGSYWAGPREAAAASSASERTVTVDGHIVARLRLRPVRRAGEAEEARFLRSQYAGIAGLTGVMLVTALAAAVLLARRWVRPLQAVQAATARIARGEFAARLPDARDDEIGDVVRNINSMAANLERIEGARRRWLADLSHELRTPLTSLRGEIEALSDGVRPLSTTAVRSLRDDVLRLNRLVDDLHLLAIADLQSLPCRFSAFDLIELVSTALARHRPAAEAAGLTLQGPLLEGLPPSVVRWDPQRIDQLLDNLLSNSLRYTDAPGTITLALHEDEAMIRLQLDDSAPGVPTQDLARVFEPLFRTDGARQRTTGGSGLGLAICAAIVQAHGGRVQASASALGGLRMDVELPKSPAEAA